MNDESVTINQSTTDSDVLKYSLISDKYLALVSSLYGLKVLLFVPSRRRC